jgi:hypothetical protein
VKLLFPISAFFGFRDCLPVYFLQCSHPLLLHFVVAALFFFQFCLFF